MKFDEAAIEFWGGEAIAEYVDLERWGTWYDEKIDEVWPHVDEKLGRLKRCIAYTQKGYVDKTERNVYYPKSVYCFFSERFIAHTDLMADFYD